VSDILAGVPDGAQDGARDGARDGEPPDLAPGLGPDLGPAATPDRAAVDLAVFAWEWTRVLAGTSWVADDRTVVADRLTRLTSRLAGALRAEAFAPEDGIEVGEALVGIGYVAPDALARTVTLLAGPEGGLTDVEQEAAISRGFIAVRLGPRVLRTETAALTALAAINTLWGDF